MSCCCITFFFQANQEDKYDWHLNSGKGYSVHGVYKLLSQGTQTDNLDMRTMYPCLLDGCYIIDF